MRTRRSPGRTVGGGGTRVGGTVGGDIVRPPAALASHLLNLQRLAGNQAVAAMLQRDKKPKTPKEPAKAGPTVTIAGLGAIPVESFQFGRERRAVAAGRQGEGEAKQPGEMRFTSRFGNHSARLMRASTGAMPGGAAVATLTSAGLTVTFTDALVTSYSVSGSRGTREGQYEQWSLNFADASFNTGAKK